MSLLYGEGERAFKRLQEEIIKTIPDHSILAWVLRLEGLFHEGDILAVSPSCFRGPARNITSMPIQSTRECRLTHQGLEIELWLDNYYRGRDSTIQVAALDCILEQPGEHSHRIWSLAPPDAVSIGSIGSWGSSHI